jgi:hypothetical protein
MIPKSGNRFSEKIMLNKKISGESDSTQLNQTLALFVKGKRKRRSMERLFCRDNDEKLRALLLLMEAELCVFDLARFLYANR